jgi:hypothetical protein
MAKECIYVLLNFWCCLLCIADRRENSLLVFWQILYDKTLEGMEIANTKKIQTPAAIHLFNHTSTPLETSRGCIIIMFACSMHIYFIWWVGLFLLVEFIYADMYNRGRVAEWLPLSSFHYEQIICKYRFIEDTSYF